LVVFFTFAFFSFRSENIDCCKVIILQFASEGNSKILPQKWIEKVLLKV